jgi:hypothetical protein
MPRYREGRLSQMAVTSLIALSFVVTACSSPSSGATAADQEQARARAQALIDEGYLLKRTGMNRDALAKLTEACTLLESKLGAATAEVASCLDDRASVLVRTGDYEKAKNLYYRALRTATAAEGADPVLVNGIRYRIALLGRLEQQGIRCAEPGEPPAEAALPYFPEVEAMQRALAELGPQAHSCASGPPRPVTLKVTLTGDGVPVMAEVRGAEAGTEVGKCVENRILRAIPGADLPGFRACFRAFTYPFPVGDIPPRAAEQPVPE